MRSGELQQVGPYTITRLFAEGSTSKFYLARHQQRKKDAVIKVLRAPLTTNEAKEAFLARAKQLKKLKHRQIIEVQDFGLLQNADGEPDCGYMVMQYAAGGSISKLIAPGQCIPADEVKRILSPIADALHYAHVNNIVHGNLHPGNLLLVGDHNETLLTDFSYMLQSVLPSFDGEAAALLYEAPEHLQGTCTTASDQYALAVMVYEWLCGRRPYEATAAEGLLYLQEHEPLPPPRSLNADISPAVEGVLLQALAHNPDERFPHTQAFANAYLYALMGLPVNLKTQPIAALTSTIDKSTVNKSVENKSPDNGNPSRESATRQISTSPPIPTVGKGIKDRTLDNKGNVDENIATLEGQIPATSPTTPATPATPTTLTTNATTNKGITELARNSDAELLPLNHLLHQHYRIIGLLGQGGGGAVYKAQDTKLGDRLVAIKELRQDDLNSQEINKAIKAFKQEAQLLAGLNHQSLPSIYEHFDEAERCYFVMDFIAGETLEEYLNKAVGRHLPVEEVLDIGIRLCSVLSYLHMHEPQVIFRDLKPSNIMRNSDGHLYLIDFGIARHFKPGKAKDTTILGTKGYAAPEQYGRAQTTPRSDIYSLGATLHQLLSGEDPAQNLLIFAPLRLGNQSALVELEALIMQMVAMEASKRPVSIAIVKQELQRISAGYTSTLQTGVTQRIQPPIILKQPNPLQVAGGIASIGNTPYTPTEPMAQHVSPPPTDSSSLGQVVSADLCQGGILSRRLPGYEERQAQIEMAELVARSLIEDTHAIVEAATGTGKALDTDTPIPTPTGWKRMGDLVAGDFVFDEQGHPTRVTAAFDVMYHRRCYEVVFSDGSSLVADAEHEWASYTCVDRSWASRPRTDTYMAKNFVTPDQLDELNRLITVSGNEDVLSVEGARALIGGHHWSVYQATRKIPPINAGGRPALYPRQTLLNAIRDRLARDLDEQRRDGRTYTLVTTEEMAATLTAGSSARANHAVAVARALVLPVVDLPIAPYFLGAWLGDGNSRNNQITSADPALITEIEKAGYTVRSLKNPYLYAVDDENGKAVSRWQPGMTGRLRALGLYLNKHIPAIYLRASEQQRRALLAGLLDTDGTVGRCGAVEYTTTSPQLAQDVYELVCSLGFRPSLRQGRAQCNGKDCGQKWTLAFTTDEQVFRLERKVVAHKERLHNYSPERNHFRYVVAVREVPSRPVRCIRVESQSHLYLAGRSMIPTHNSLAYLVPIVRSGKVAIVSTANKALQEQLFYKDIPFVQKNIKHFDAALVKGMGNYVCLDRLENERVGIQFYAKNRDFMRLLAITQDADSTFNGDFEMLGFPLPGDIRSKVNADSDQCAWGKCNFYADCYVRKMRVKAEHAQIIVVNHTLLLLDAVLEGYLLPERDVVVVDEAHHLEEEATRCFTITVSPAQVSTLLAQRMLKEHTPLAQQDEANQVMMEAWERLAQVADPGFKGRANLQAPLEEGLHLASVIAKLADSLFAQRPNNMPEKESQLYDKLLVRTQNLAANIRTVFSVDQVGKYVYYVERINTNPSGRRSPGQLQVSAAPLDVTALLKELLFNKCNVICTSATLATVGTNPVKLEEKGPNFAYFRRRTGLDYVEYPDTLERILPLTFDYESNALLYLPRHLPEPVYGPGSGDYTKAIADEMQRLVKASRGRAFLLFSSKRMLEEVYELLVPHLDFPLLRQGDLPRIELTRKFREEVGAVLFGLKSFWEGVDIAGEALSLVVIDKLPFDPPDDPVHEARVAQMKAAGENWFGTYVLPQAALRLKQGLGRLLRTREDRGVMAILDARLHTKSYGRTILGALPPARRTASLKEVEQFFSEEPAPF